MTQPRFALLTAALAACLVTVGTLARAEDPAATPDSTSDLAPTSSVPWNPPRAISNHEAWEQVLNAPLTLVSLPIRAVGALTEAGLLRVQEDRLVPRVQYGLAITMKSGLMVGGADLGERSGLGGAVGYAPPQLRGWLRTSLAGSFRRYHRESVELGPPWLFAGYTRDGRPQEPFFGTGPAAFEGDASNYGVESERAELHLRLRRGTRVRREAGAWLGDRQNVHRSGRERDRPSFETVFPPLAPDALGVEQHHVITGVRFALDTRSGRPHWSGGARLDAQAERFSGRNAGSPGFRRYTLAGQVGWSFMRDPRTLRLAARVVDVVPLDRTRPPLLSDLSRLGGSAGLDGFEPGRFHDLDLLVVKLGYIFPLVEYAELELSTEIGGVSGDVWRETRIDRLERSYSVMLRPRKHTAPLGAFGVSWSREGTRVRFALGGVE